MKYNYTHEKSLQVQYVTKEVKHKRVHAVWFPYLKFKNRQTKLWQGRSG